MVAARPAHHFGGLAIFLAALVLTAPMPVKLSLILSQGQDGTTRLI